MKNNLIAILCHCNTAKKEALLKKNIEIIKQQGHDILVVSHIPVSYEIQNEVEYCIYDKSNPLISYPDRGMVYWQYKNIIGSRIKLQNIMPDYGWTAFNQILNVSRFALPLNYSHYTFLNYDALLTDIVLHELKEPADFVTSKVKDERNENGFRYPSFMLNILTKNNLQKLLPLISKEDYMCDTHIVVEGGKFKDAEQYWGHLTSIFNQLILKEQMVDQISFDFPNIFDVSEHLEFKIFFQNNNTFERIDTNSFTPRVLVYENTAEELVLNINKQQINIENDYIQDLPEIDTIGYTYKGEYVDLTEIYNNANFATINYV
jgi:hypothetical protein